MAVVLCLMRQTGKKYNKKVVSRASSKGKKQMRVRMIEREAEQRRGACLAL